MEHVVEVSARRPHVWLFDVRESAFDALADADFVSDAERHRAARATDPRAERAAIGRRSALRLLLGRYLGEAPRDVRIVTAPGGKPVLLPRVPSERASADDEPTGGAPAFSVCHTGDLYCVAVGHERSLGLDVERLREVARARSIAERWFGSGERERFADLDGEALTLEFMRMWTAKEALAKRHGAGLRLMRGDDAELDVDGNVASGHLRYFPPGEGYVGALAATRTIEDVLVRRPEEDFWTI